MSRVASSTYIDPNDPPRLPQFRDGSPYADLYYTVNITHIHIHLQAPPAHVVNLHPVTDPPFCINSNNPPRLPQLNNNENRYADVDGITVRRLPQLNNNENRYADVDGISFGVASRVDWHDGMLLNRPGVKRFALVIEKIAELGKSVVWSLMTEVNEQTIGAIVVMTWNLISTSSERRIFPEVDETGTKADMNFDQIRTGARLNVHTGAKPIFEGDSLSIARGTAYLCCSFIRLLTKSVENYLNAWPLIKSQYQKFYRSPFPIPNFEPSSQMMEYIKNAFARKDYFRDGIIGLLYHHNSPLEDLDLRCRLYEEHLSCTGMHAYSLVLQICDVTKFTIGRVLEALHHGRNKDAVKELATIFRQFSRSVDPNKRRGTWKYARVFNQEYFTSVQTKNCSVLVGVLAVLSKCAGGQQGNSGDVMNITQIQNLSPLMRQYCERVGQRAYQALYNDAHS